MQDYLQNPHTREDIFSRRTSTSFDPLEIQQKILTEDIIRRHPYEVAHGGTIYKASPPLSLRVMESFIDALTESLGLVDHKLNIGVPPTYAPQNFLLSSENTLLQIIVLRTGGATEESDSFDEDDELPIHLTRKEATVVSSSVSFSTYETLEIVAYSTDRDILHKFQAVIDRLGIPLAPAIETKENKTAVVFTYPTDIGVTFNHNSFDSIPFASIRQNYTEDSAQHIEHIIQTIKKSQKGLVILHGEPGSGKSYAIRSILSEIQDRKGIVCTPPSSFLQEFGMLVETTAAFPKSLIILEDVGDFLAADNAMVHANETSNLLNITEGLLSLLSNTIFLLTFNRDIGGIDEALRRPGRCLGEIRLDSLPYEHACRLVGHELPEKRNYTLAEVYDYKNNKEIPYVQKKKKALGFNLEK